MEKEEGEDGEEGLEFCLSDLQSCGNEDSEAHEGLERALSGGGVRSKGFWASACLLNLIPRIVRLYNYFVSRSLHSVPLVSEKKNGVEIPKCQQAS